MPITEKEYLEAVENLRKEFYNREFMANPFMKPQVCGYSCIHLQKFEEEVAKLRKDVIWTH